MYRLVLLRRSPDEHILICTFDHLIFDDRAVEIFVSDLCARYGDGADERAVPQAEHVTLAACLGREHRRFDRRATTVSAAYWADRYAAAPPVLQLAGAKRQLRLADPERRELHYSPEAALSSQLNAACRASGSSRFELFTAAFANAAFTLTGQDRLPIYIPMNCRERANNNTIGNFAGVRPLVVSRDACREMPSAVAEIRKAALPAFAHRHVDYTMEQQALDLQRVRWGVLPKRQLVVNYLKAYEDLPSGRPLRGVRLALQRYAPMVPARGTTLAIYIRDYDDQFWARFEYSSDLDDLISEFAVLFRQTLEQTAAAGQPASVPQPNPMVKPPGRTHRAELTPLRFADGAVCLSVDRAEVRTALLSHEAVGDAEVDVVRHDGGGTELVARVCVASNVTDEDLRQACLSWPEASQYLVPPARFARAGPADKAASGVALTSESGQ